MVEDDYDHEFHYEARPVAPIASADDAGVVIYLGTLSKILAPGLRLGLAVAPPAVVEQMVAVRAAIDIQGDHAIEHAVAELFEDGEVQRHVRRMREVYRRRRDALAGALRRELAGALDFEVPAGGMAIWAAAKPGIDSRRGRWPAASSAWRFAARGSTTSPAPRCRSRGCHSLG
jgi:GntR family transcriptional regulator/MocR family aminotransferase